MKTMSATVAGRANMTRNGDDRVAPYPTQARSQLEIHASSYPRITGDTTRPARFVVNPMLATTAKPCRKRQSMSGSRCTCTMRLACRDLFHNLEARSGGTAPRYASCTRGAGDARLDHDQDFPEPARTVV